MTNPLHAPVNAIQRRIEKKQGHFVTFNQAVALTVAQSAVTVAAALAAGVVLSNLLDDEKEEENTEI